MKKILTLIITLTFVFSLGACNNAPTDYVTQDEFDQYQLDTDVKIDTMQDYLDRMVWVGYMLPEGNVDMYNEASTFYVSRLGFEFLTSTEKDYLDKTKFPSYIFDEFENYITIGELGNLLSQKYLGINSTTITGFQYKMSVYQPDDMTDEDYITRLSMMIMELAEYDFYTLDSPELQLVVKAGGSSIITIRMSLLTTDKYNLHPAMFWSGMLDTRITGISYEVLVVEALYDQYVLDETFIGYVLNYTK